MKEQLHKKVKGEKKITIMAIIALVIYGLLKILLYVKVLPIDIEGEHTVQLYIDSIYIVFTFCCVALYFFYNKKNQSYHKIKSMEEQEERYKELFNIASEGVWEMDDDDHIYYKSTNWYTKLGIDVENHHISQWIGILHEEEKADFVQRLKKHKDNYRDMYKSEYRILDKEGKVRWIRSLGKARYKEEKYVGLYGVHIDFTEEKEHANQLLLMAYLDQLTGMNNRFMMQNLVKTYVDGKVPFTVFHLNISDFKYINDNFGHEFGDEVIRHFGRRLQDIVSANEVVARVSGDEFALVLRGNGEREHTKKRVEEVIAKVEKKMIIKENALDIKVSIGIASYPANAKNDVELLVNAGMALQTAKKSKDEKYVYYAASMKKKILDKANTGRYLAYSLEEKELYVKYQPVIDNKDYSIHGFEALVRWNSSFRGEIYPDEFIPLAEKTGFIIEIGNFVLEEGIKFSKALYEKYKRYYTMNINVSAVQLQNDDFLQLIKKLVKKYEYPVKYLNMEITETATLESNIEIMDRLIYIRNMGIDVSLDDFGTGYSSISHLLNLPITHLKIDKSLVQEATTSENVRKLIQGVIEFAHTAEVKVVAEGIEDKRTEALVKEMNIQLSQGYLYAKPLDTIQVYEFIDTYKK